MTSTFVDDCLHDDTTTIGRIIQRMDQRTPNATSEQRDAFAQYMRLLADEMRHEGIHELNRLEFADFVDHFTAPQS